MPEAPSLRVDEFVRKWLATEQGEQSLAQSQFNDICAVLGVETPAEADAAGRGAEYAFEKRTGDRKAADIWKKDCFAWEYKSPGRSLEEALFQINTLYRDALGNPPLLVASDMRRFEIRTNFTGTNPVAISFTLEDWRDNPSRFRDVLRAVFTDPWRLHPERSPEYITETAARKIGEVAIALRERDGQPADQVARFLIRLVFCFFAESMGLFRPEQALPRDVSDRTFTPVLRLFEAQPMRPTVMVQALERLFAAMSSETDIAWGYYAIRWFNGGLFDEAAAREIPLMTSELLFTLQEVSELDWSKIDPAIMGTLFERGLDPKRRSQIGAHFTDAERIMKVVGPVVAEPLRREFAELRERWADRGPSVAEPGAPYNGRLVAEDDPAQAEARRFHERLAAVRVLDPACGSGNFLYVALRELKNLEQDFLDWAAEALEMRTLQRRVGPESMLGIDIDPFAVELTRVSLWIGEIQWVTARWAEYGREPVLGRTDQIECRDALLERNAFGGVAAEPAEWPEAEFIVGNPPFLGSKRMPAELGEEYVELLHECWREWVPGGADLSIYWHEQARRRIAAGSARRAGLLATQNVRGVMTRPVLERIGDSGGIFFAYSNEPWIGDGAAVRISVVGQDDGTEQDRHLDERSVTQINPDLTTGPYLRSARVLDGSRGVAFIGGERNGPFDIDADVAERMLGSAGNPNGRPNSDVILPFITASDLARRARDRYIIDFARLTEAEAADYAEPFEYARRVVKPVRDGNADRRLRERWWLHAQPAAALREAIEPLARWIVTPVTSKHRFFAWRDMPAIHDNTLVVIARSDDYAFGVLSSTPHTLWAVGIGTRIGQGNDPRYVHGSTFNTFPFPWPLDIEEEAPDEGRRSRRAAVATAAAELERSRGEWLNADSGRTMTELYNEMPSWFLNRQRELDLAVLAAYGWGDLDPEGEDFGEAVLERLLALNLARAGERL